jgi:hypothetical protein
VEGDAWAGEEIAGLTRVKVIASAAAQQLGSARWLVLATIPMIVVHVRGFATAPDRSR